MNNGLISFAYAGTNEWPSVLLTELGICVKLLLLQESVEVTPVKSKGKHAYTWPGRRKGLSITSMTVRTGTILEGFPTMFIVNFPYDLP